MSFQVFFEVLIKWKILKVEMSSNFYGLLYKTYNYLRAKM